MKSVHHRSGAVPHTLRSNTLLGLNSFTFEDSTGCKAKPGVDVQFPQIEISRNKKAIGSKTSFDINRSYIHNYQTIQKRRDMLKPRHKPSRQSWTPADVAGATVGYFAPLSHVHTTCTSTATLMVQKSNIRHAYKRCVTDHIQPTAITHGSKLDYMKSWLTAECPDVAIGGSISESISDEDALHLNSIADYTVSSTLSSGLSSNKLLLLSVRNEIQHIETKTRKENFEEKLHAFLTQYTKERQIAPRNRTIMFNGREKSSRKLGTIVSSQRLGQLLNNKLPLSLNNFYTSHNR